MKKAGALLLAILAFAVQPAGAFEVRTRPVAVMELFTSQGCSSCPPADAMFAQAAKRKDVVALAYHVDYWDYIGWPDSFGAETWSDFQRSYAKSWGSARVYTPQLVVNGVQGVVGSRKNEVDQAMAASALKVPVMVSREGDVLDVGIEAQSGLPNAIVWLVTYRDRSDVKIERGENEGKTVTYTQIVTGRQVLAMWDARSGAHFKLPLAEILTGTSNGAAIIVQEEKKGLPGAILGAAAIQL